MNFKKFQLLALKTEIKRLASDGRVLNKKISSTADVERHILRREKASIGRKAREYLLAYAFLRGVPYKVLEGEKNASYSYYMTEAMLKIIRSHLPENECDVSILTNWVFPPKSEAA